MSSCLTQFFAPGKKKALSINISVGAFKFYKVKYIELVANLSQEQPDRFSLMN